MAFNRHNGCDKHRQNCSGVGPIFTDEYNARYAKIEKERKDKEVKPLHTPATQHIVDALWPTINDDDPDLDADNIKEQEEE